MIWLQPFFFLSTQGLLKGNLRYTMTILGSLRETLKATKTINTPLMTTNRGEHQSAL